MKKTKWLRIFEDYIKDDNVTCSSLSEKYNVSSQAIYERAKKEHWDIIRQKTRTSAKKDSPILHILAEQFKTLREKMERKQK